MKTSNVFRRTWRRSAGMGLVTAIFLLVVLAALGVAMVTLYTTQQNSATLDDQGSRAYQAARAGIEWGLYQRFRNGSCVASTTFALPSGTTMQGFSVTVNCTRIAGPAPILGPPAALDRWVITATACNMQPAAGACLNPINNPDYVRRKIEVQI